MGFQNRRESILAVDLEILRSTVTFYLTTGRETETEGRWPGKIPADGDRRRRGRWSTEEVTGRVVGRGVERFVGSERAGSCGSRTAAASSCVDSVHGKRNGEVRVSTGTVLVMMRSKKEEGRESSNTAAGGCPPRTGGASRAAEGCRSYRAASRLSWRCTGEWRGCWR